MALKWEISGSLVLVTAEGQLETAGVRPILETAVADPAFVPGMRLLIHDPGSNLNPTAREVADLARDLALFKDRLTARMALAVERDVHYGMGRMLEVYCERHGVCLKVFRDLRDARAWLEENGSRQGSG